jgi:uncharacterized protein (DUF2342 family)
MGSQWARLVSLRIRVSDDVRRRQTRPIAPIFPAGREQVMNAAELGDRPADNHVTLDPDR